ncbi:hypothetical protein AB4090_04825 [Acidithiobacillus sp. IBUN Pt1247-S3]|uniref:hypothetical protein n=1 Tax=Acidithiobacillus sp. IBUN Pt1247-S3 TaxID=3166642 RepID=UPI0034E529BE
MTCAVLSLHKLAGVVEGVRMAASDGMYEVDDTEHWASATLHSMAEMSRLLTITDQVICYGMKAELEYIENGLPHYGNDDPRRVLLGRPMSLHQGPGEVEGLRLLPEWMLPNVTTDPQKMAQGFTPLVQDTEDGKKRVVLVAGASSMRQEGERVYLTVPDFGKDSPALPAILRDSWPLQQAPGSESDFDGFLDDLDQKDRVPDTASGRLRRFAKHKGLPLPEPVEPSSDEMSADAGNLFLH